MRFAPAALSFFLWTARGTAFGVPASRRQPPRALLGAGLRRFRADRKDGLVATILRQQCPSLYYYRGGGGEPAMSLANKHSVAAAVTSSRSMTTYLNSAVAAGAAAEGTETAPPPVEIFRKDYQPLPFTVDTMKMIFDIRDGKTTVTSEMKLIRNPDATDNNNQELVLNGDETAVKLVSIQMDGRDLTVGTDYEVMPGQLVLKQPRSGSVVRTVVEIVPEDNTQLSGLYQSGSGDMYTTQCEALGFRRITYYPDRPDNMATFASVRIEADQAAYPVLLSNGNLIESGNLEGGRHYATWSDPFPKPCYLFATVAGKLGKITDTFTTRSGQTVELAIYSEPRNVHKLQFAMDSLKRSMQWDEDRFHLEYDLNIFNIVATPDFNMGAMENKSLNIFNTALVYADQKTATDADFERVEGVIGHEYFHNWTGNRVTCRDWFQLTLKEGLTVFRDQEFSGDMNSKPVKRIEDVRVLRAAQFREDAGPMAHPIRPDSYISMDNFYTPTVYIKGAEVIRMYQTLLGVEGFNKGMKLYFERHDGSAVTCDDFLAAMADANGVDLSQFARWYETLGTPVVKYSSSYNDGTFTLELSQESKSDKPLHIPVSVGLLDKHSGETVVETTVLDLKEKQQTFTFDGLKGEVISSILRDFSAPVKLQPKSGAVDEEALAFLAARDTDGFNRWESGQRLYTSLILQTMNNKQSDKTVEYVKKAFRRTLLDKSSTDFSIEAYELTLPSESTLAEEVDLVDPIAIHKAHGEVKKMLAREFQNDLMSNYNEMTFALEAEGDEFKIDSESIGRRRLRNVLLDYLCALKDTDEQEMAAAALATNHYRKAKGMTDKMAALQALASMGGRGAKNRDDALQQFYNDAEGDALVLNKWFSVQAMANLDDVVERVKTLKEHPDFTLKNPNRCRALISVFTGNAIGFHHESGEGYKFVGDTLAELDKLNPQISSKIASCLIQWRRYDEKRGQQMKKELEKLAAGKLSDDLYEVVSKALK